MGPGFPRLVARALAVGGIAAAIAVGGGAPAHADATETEARLKSAGVPRELRAKIHAAIDAGVAYLGKVQRPDGRWRDARVYPDWYEWGITALCALAQRHAGTPAGTESAHKAMAWLAASTGTPPPPPSPTRSRPIAPMLEHVYCAGLWLLCLQADGRPAAEAAPLVAALSRGLDPDSSWWGYTTTNGAGSIPNLSTSQFAALGLWAGGRIGAPADRGTWTAHLSGLCDSQGATGSWGYVPHIHDLRGRSVQPLARAYPTATFMGCANLALALAGSQDAAAPLPAPLAAVRAKALARLEKDARAFLEAMDGSRPTFDYAITVGFSYYALYALEKACVLSDLPTVDGVAWYVKGAEALLAMQSKNGAWTCRGDYDPLASTAFALLFLLRSSESFHPTTPRSIDTPPPPPVTTPSSPPGEPPAPAMK